MFVRSMFKPGDFIKVNISDQQFLPSWLQGKLAVVIKKRDAQGPSENNLYRVLIKGEQWVVAEKHSWRIDERF